ncbi:putative monooxygenase ycnE [Bacteroidales bacterium Barb7]|nr:putative monooxygenase ycnE [Bacteroidales bacterium Barb7]
MKRIIRNGLLLCAFCAMLASVSSCQEKKEAAVAGDTPEVVAESVAVATGEELLIVAHVAVKPEFEAEVIEAFQAVVSETRKESGNISYNLYQDINDPLKFTFVEEWKSQDAIQSHSASEHFQTFAKAIDGKADLDVSTLKQTF